MTKNRAAMAASMVGGTALMVCGYELGLMGVAGAGLVVFVLGFKLSKWV